MISPGLVATLGAATLVVACGSTTNAERTLVAPAGSTSVAESSASARSSATETSTTHASSTLALESEVTSNAGTATLDVTNSNTSIADASTTVSDAETASGNTSSTTSHETTATSDASSTASESTTSDTTTLTSTLRLTSPVLEGSLECTTSTPDTCNVFQNENISYMDNANISPALEWTGAPEGTQSFAITLRDVTYGQPLWAIWNIPASETGLPPDLPKDSATLTTPQGAEQSNASFADGDGYFGPQAPCNVFQFELFALSIPAFEPDYKEYAAEVDAQLNLLEAKILGRAPLAGRTKYNSTCDMM